jgi:hypothetical protein
MPLDNLMIVISENIPDDALSTRGQFLVADVFLKAVCARDGEAQLERVAEGRWKEIGLIIQWDDALPGLADELMARAQCQKLERDTKAPDQVVVSPRMRGSRL